MKSMDKMTNQNKLLIICARGYVIVVVDIVFKMNRWQQIAFLDDDETINSSMEIDVIGKSSGAFKYVSECDILVAIGNNKTKEKIQYRLNWQEPAYLH